MKDSTKKRVEMEGRRRKVAALYLRKVKQEDIAKKLGISQATASRDLTWLRKRWREEAVADMDARRGRELAELEEMELDCAVQFAASKDAKWLGLRLKVKERIAKLLGLDAPTKAQASLLNVDMGKLTDEQLRRIADGEDPALVLATSGQGGD